ncbi:MAG: hypothetical protein K6E51_02830 [Treponema sp.]|nr:hypothetical protein [Treponema sp.]
MTTISKYRITDRYRFVLEIVIVTLYLFTTVFCYSQDVKQEFLDLVLDNNCWLPVAYLEVVDKNDREVLKKIVPDFEYEGCYDEPWQQHLDWNEAYIIYDMFEKLKYEDFIALENRHYQYLELDSSAGYEYIITDVEKADNTYHLNLKQTTNSIFNTGVTQRKENSLIIPVENLRKVPLYKDDPAYYDEDEYKFHEIFIDAVFDFNGNYLTVTANDGKFSQKFFRCEPETFDLLKKLIYVNALDTKVIVSCENEMTVKEKLKLRCDGHITGEVKRVLPAGTRVKVIGLGKICTIDGITSNWVQIELVNEQPKDTYDYSTFGWCFGGYLE